MVNKLALAIIAAATLTMIVPFASIARADSEFASIQTFQDSKHIVITIAKNGQPAEGPIIVVPPKQNETDQNGTIILPNENATAENPGNVTIIEPGGNVTVLPGDSNVTEIDNGTVIVAPPDRNITETPGNVTVVDPPTNPPANQSGCSCGNNNQPSQPPENNTVVTPPSPGNITNSGNVTQPNPPANQSGSNETNPPQNNTAGNETSGNNTINTQRQIPALLANPVASVHRILFPDTSDISTS